MTRISLFINGENAVADVEPRMHLGDFLRDHLLLTGTHLGCEHGICGACTVEIDGAPARSCITLAVACDGAEIRTIEGFDDDVLMAEIREAFSREHALQCGYCTPGMLISARDLVKRLPEADEMRIRREMEGNLCRCTGYIGIVRAIASVAGKPITERETVIKSSEEIAVSQKPLEYIGGIALPTDAMHLIQSFKVNRSLDQVWSLFHDIEAVAECMPGAKLTSFSPQGQAEGQINLAFGPIRAIFSGRARVSFNESDMSGKVEGNGRDNITGSSVTCGVDFKLEGDDKNTAVNIKIGYSLSGSLAQFGRTELAAGVAQQLTEKFSKNLKSRLVGQAEREIVRQIGLMSLIIRILKTRFLKLLGN